MSTAVKETSLPTTPGMKPRCPNCAALPHLVTNMLDTHRGKNVRLYRCDCGQRIWDE
jgi:hypothetical protein